MTEQTVKALRITMPSRSVLDPAFKYTPSCKTDLRETFRKARAAQQQQGVVK